MRYGAIATTPAVSTIPRRRRGILARAARALHTEPMVQPVEPVLSVDECEFFVEHGWVVAKHVIDGAQAARTAREVWDFAGLDASDADSWYQVTTAYAN